MDTPRQPLLFTPLYKDYIWGGNRLAGRFGRTDTPAVCAESWEISAHPDGPSVVRSGRWAGLSLPALVQRHGRALLGARAPDPDRFPLLFKIIDARERLSVQVHPGERTAAACGGDPKTEMWYALDCAPGAELFVGLKPGTDARTLRAALADRKGGERLARVRVRPDDAVFIPGGLVHAIGEGCLLYEIQQNSNTTYRLYDWDRIGKDSLPRPLHIEKALAAIDWDLPPAVPLASAPAARQPDDAWCDVLACPFFRVRRAQLTKPVAVPQDGGSFHALFAVSGRITVEAGGATTDWPAGTSGLVPAAAGGFLIAPAGGTAVVLMTTL